MELGIGGLGYATEIGAGASAIVYRARQLDLDREVAVKVLSVGDEAFVRRFAREAKTLGKLSQNPGIVTVYDTGVTGTGQPYLILELCDYSVLDRLNSADGPFDPLDACRAGAQVADAVSDAHNNGVIHRDIKPGNVLVSQTGRYMVTDFGISTVTGATMGQTNSVGFTAGYVAPETLSGEAASTPADIYAIGATLFHMITGKAPYVDVEQHSNLLALAQRVIHDPVPDLRPRGVPDEVCRIIEGAMSKRPLDRPTAAQVRDQLQAVVRDLSDPPADGSSEHPPSTVGAVAGIAAPAIAAGVGSAGSVVEAEGTDDGPASELVGRGVTTMDEPATGVEPSRADGTVAMDGPTDLGVPANLGPAPATVATHSVEDDQNLSRTTTANGGDSADGPEHVPMQPSNRQGPPSTGGILNHRVVDPPAPGPPVEDRRFAYTSDDRRMLTPLLVGAVVATVALLGLGGFLVSRSGDDAVESEAGGTQVETVGGPSTSFSANGNEARGGGPNGGRGTLEPGQTGDDSDITDGTGRPLNVVVPSVVNKPLTEARSRLSALGLVPNPVDEESTSVPEGTVIRQSPSAGSTRSKGSTITIYIASARPAETVLVPSLTGDTRAEAEATLVALGLEVSATTASEPHPTVAADLVIGSAPASGSTVNVGSTVSLVLSSGPGSPVCSAMIGLSQTAATGQLEAAGLTVSATRQASQTVPVNEVLSCTRTASTASLVVSSGPVNAAICSQVIGTQLAAATATLEAEGLTVSDTAVASETSPAGEVLTCTITGTTAAITYATTMPTGCQGAVGKTVAQARTLLEGLGFTDIVTNSVPSETVPQGQVIGCAAAGTIATLTVSSGEAGQTVPNVVGMKRAAGVAALRAAGFEVSTPVTVPDSRPAGEIISTNPAGGTSAPAGSIVAVTVSSGPASTVAVPALAGLTRAAATLALNATGLTPSFTNRELAAGSPDIGKVVAVSPSAGTQVAPGSTVTVTIGVAPDNGR